MRFSFAFKMGLINAIVAVCAITTSVLLIYNRTSKMTIELMNDRLKDIGKVSTYIFKESEIEIIKKLTKKIQKDSISYTDKLKSIKPGETMFSLPIDKANRYMKTEEFQILVKRLRELKGISKRFSKPKEDTGHTYYVNQRQLLIQYAYILITIPESADYSVLKFLVDADYEAVGIEEGNPIGNLYRVKQKSFKEAFKGMSSAEDKFITDRWGTWLTAAVPIYDKKENIIAIIGLDLNVSSEANKVKELLYICLYAISITLIISILTSIILSNVLSKPIKKLRKGAEQVGKRDFSAQIDIKSRDELGLLADTFNSMVTEIKDYANELEETNKVYYRFVPKEFLRHLGLEKITDIKLGAQIQGEMSILFSDIRSFTTMSETMSPKDNFDFLNSYLRRVGPIIRERDGFIDKYIGDAIMAIFPGSADDSVCAAIEMRKELRIINAGRIKKGFNSINIGVGIHTGNLMMGTIGEEERMESTVISDSVNLASRLEGLSKTFNSPILISKNTFLKIDDINMYKWRNLGRVQVKGKQQGVNIYEIIDGETEEIIELRLSTKEDFENGLALFQKGDFGNAEDYFKKILEKDKTDRAADVYLKRCYSHNK